MQSISYYKENDVCYKAYIYLVTNKDNLVTKKL